MAAAERLSGRSASEVLGRIVRLQLERIRARIDAQHGIPFVYDEDAVKMVIRRCTEIDSGGRMIDAILTNSVLPSISREYLTRLATGTPLSRISLSAGANDFLYDFSEAQGAQT